MIEGGGKKKTTQSIDGTLPRSLSLSVQPATQTRPLLFLLPGLAKDAIKWSWKWLLLSCRGCVNGDDENDNEDVSLHQTLNSSSKVDRNTITTKRSEPISLGLWVARQERVPPTHTLNQSLPEAN